MANDPDRKYQDLADVRALLGAPGLDREEVRGYFEWMGLPESGHELE